MKQQDIMKAQLDGTPRLIQIRMGDIYIEFQGMVFKYGIGTGPKGLRTEIECRRVECIRIVCDLEEAGIRVLNPDGTRCETPTPVGDAAVPAWMRPLLTLALLDLEKRKGENLTTWSARLADDVATAGD
jgi:hypothetical protein